MDRAYRNSIRVISLILAGVGVAMVIATFARGGGPLDVGVLLGVLLVASASGGFLLARGGPAA